jgi:flagellar basal-body rod modification protein FlgD
MSLVENIKDGNVVGPKSLDNLKNKDRGTEKTAANRMEDTKQMFMQLLVAEMKYQNPLEPTDNTEYIKEMANFSQVEALQNVATDMNSIHADSLVGKYANVAAEDGTVLTGRVESSTIRDGVTYLMVEGKEYKLSEIKGVQDEDYYEANLAAQTITEMLKSLPKLNELTKADSDKVVSIKNLYDSMNVYQRGFIPQEVSSTINAYVARIVELNAAGQNQPQPTETTAETSAESSATTAETSTEPSATDSQDNTAASGA